MKQDNPYEELRPAFENQPEIPAPDEQRQAAARAAFLMKARNMRKASPVSRGEVQRLRGWLFANRRHRQRRFGMLAIAIAVVMIATTAVGGVAYASDAAAPGDTLYGVDRQGFLILGKRVISPIKKRSER